MGLFELYDRCRTEESAFNVAIELGLINMNVKSCLCGEIMKIEKGHVRHGIDGIWRCSKRSCRNTTSLFDNTIFYGMKVPISKALLIWYMHGINMTNKSIAEELKIDRDTVSLSLEKIYEKLNHQNRVIIGTTNDVYEVDETHIVSRRDSRGRILPGERYWIIGIINRSNKKIALRVVRNRTLPLCTSFILSTIPQGATVYTDSWRGYNALRSHGYDHHTVNHKYEFVRSDNPDIHTQTIERLWKTFKEKNIHGISFEIIVESAKRFVYVYNSGVKTNEERFNSLMQLNRV